MYAQLMQQKVSLLLALKAFNKESERLENNTDLQTGGNV